MKPYNKLQREKTMDEIMEKATGMTRSQRYKIALLLGLLGQIALWVFLLR
jgi:hypothetical protein